MGLYEETEEEKPWQSAKILNLAYARAQPRTH
jgi:hypothetical protein